MTTGNPTTTAPDLSNGRASRPDAEDTEPGAPAPGALHHVHMFATSTQMEHPTSEPVGTLSYDSSDGHQPAAHIQHQPPESAETISVSSIPADTSARQQPNSQEIVPQMSSAPSMAYGGGAAPLRRTPHTNSETKDDDSPVHTCNPQSESRGGDQQNTREQECHPAPQHRPGAPEPQTQGAACVGEPIPEIHGGRPQRQHSEPWLPTKAQAYQRYDKQVATAYQEANLIKMGHANDKIVISINVNGFKPKLEAWHKQEGKFHEMITNLNPDIILVSEAHYSQKDDIPREQETIKDLLELRMGGRWKVHISPCRLGFGYAGTMAMIRTASAAGTEVEDWACSSYIGPTGAPFPGKPENLRRWADAEPWTQKHGQLEGRYTILWNNTETANPHVMVVMYGVYPKRGDVRGGPANAIVQEIRKLINYLTRTFDDPTITICGDTNTFEGPETYKLEGVEEASGTPVSSLISQHLKIWAGEMGLAGANEEAQDRHAALMSGRGGNDTVLHDMTERSGQSRASVQMTTKWLKLKRQTLDGKSKPDLRLAILKLLDKTEADTDSTTTIRKSHGGGTVTISAMRFHEEQRTFLMRLDHVFSTHPGQITPVISAEYSSLVKNEDRMGQTDHAAVIFSIRDRDDSTEKKGTVIKRNSNHKATPYTNTTTLDQSQILDGFVMAAGYALEEEATRCAMYIPQGDFITKAEEATGKVHAYMAAQTAKMLRLVSKQAWEEPTLQRLRQAPPLRKGGKPAHTAFAKAEQQGTTPHESQEDGVEPDVSKSTGLDPSKESHLHPAEVRAAPVTAIARRAQALHDRTTRTMTHEKYVPHQRTPLLVNGVAFLKLVSQTASETGMPLTSAVRAARIHLGEKKAQSEPPADREKATEDFRKSCAQSKHSTDVVQIRNKDGLTIVRKTPQQGGERGEKPTPVGAQEDPAGSARESGSRRAMVEAARLAGRSRLKAAEKCARILHNRARENRRTHISTTTIDGNLINDITRLETIVGRLRAAQREFIDTGTVVRAGDNGGRSSDIKHCTRHLSKTATLLALKIEKSKSAWRQARNKAEEAVAAKEIRQAWGHLMRGTLIMSWHREVTQRREQAEKTANNGDLGLYLKPAIGSDNAQRLNKIMTLFRVDSQLEIGGRERQHGRVWERMIATGEDIMSYLGDEQHDKDELWQHLTGRHRTKPDHIEIDASPIPAASPQLIRQRWKRVTQAHGGERAGDLHQEAEVTPTQATAEDILDQKPTIQQEAPQWRFHLRCKRAAAIGTSYTTGIPNLNPRTVSDHLERIRRQLKENIGAPSAWAWHRQPEGETEDEAAEGETAYLEVYHDLQPEEASWITRIASTITPEMTARVGRYYQSRTASPPRHDDTGQTIARNSDENHLRDQHESAAGVNLPECKWRMCGSKAQMDPDNHRYVANMQALTLKQLLQAIQVLQSTKRQRSQKGEPPTVLPRPPKRKQATAAYIRTVGGTWEGAAVRGGQPPEVNLLENVGAPFYTSAYIGRSDDLNHRIKCTVLIDSGCATEFVSDKMARKLKEQSIINDNDNIKATEIRAQSAFGQDEHTRGALQLGLSLNHIDLTEDGNIRGQGLHNHKIAARVLDNLQVDLIIGARGIRHHGIHIPGELEEEDVTGWIGSPIQIGPRKNPTAIRCHTHVRWQVGDQAPVVARENITWAAQGTKQLIKLGIQLGTHMVTDLKRRMERAELTKRPQKYFLRLEPLNDDPTQAQVNTPTLMDIAFEKNCTCNGTCGCGEEVVATALVTSGAARDISDLPPGTLLGTAILESKRLSETTPVNGGVSPDSRIQTHADTVGQLMAVNILSTKGQGRLDSKNPLHWHSQKILHDQSETDKNTLTGLWRGDPLRGLASLQATEAHRVVKEYLQQNVIIANGGGDTVIINPTNAGRALAELAALLEVTYKTAPYIIGPATQHHEWQKLAKLVGNPTKQMQEPEPGTEWAICLIKDSMHRIFHIKRAMASKMKVPHHDDETSENGETSPPVNNVIGLATVEASTMAWHQHLAGTTSDIRDRSSMAPGSPTRTDITRCTGRAWKLLSKGHAIEAKPGRGGGMEFTVNTAGHRRTKKRESHVTTAIVNAITLHGHRLRNLAPSRKDESTDPPPCEPCAPEQAHKGGPCGCHDQTEPPKTTVTCPRGAATVECNKMSVAERAPEALEHHLQRQQIKLADREAAQQGDNTGERMAKTEEVGMEDPSTSPPAAMSRVDCYAGARAKIPPYMPSQEARKKIWWWPRESIENERNLLQKLLKIEEDKTGGGLRRIAYLQSVQFNDEMKQQLEDPETFKEEAENDDPSTPHNMRRARAHLHVWNCIRNFKTIDVDPYNGPTIDTATLGSEFLTLTTKEAIFDPPRQLPPDAVEQANDMVDYMVRSGQAIEATSSFNHNVLLVPKKQDRNTTQKSWRLCNDLRRLNEKTLRTHWRLLPTMSSLEAAAEFDRFSVSDAVSGYYQCRIDPSISHKFSFSVGNRRLVPTKSLMGGLNSGALYCLAMARAIGHMNTGICELDRRNRLIKRDPDLLEAAKQRHTEGIRILDGKKSPWEPASADEHDMQGWVERALDHPRPTIEQAQRGDDSWHECDGIPTEDTRHRCKAMSYVDDVIIAGKDNSTGTEQENAVTFSRCNARVLEQLGAHGAMLKAQKTTFDTKRLEFLGWEIGPEGLQPNTKKINAFTRMCRPRNKDELQRFIGCTQYFRNTIPAISLHEQPLYDLTKKGVTWKWTSVEDAAFNEIKRLLSSDTILARRNPDCSHLILAVDSSTIGTGAVLSQVRDGKEEAIAYISTTFKNGGSWSGTEKEVTGILWAIQEVRQLIHDKRLTVITDHRPVKSIVTKRNLNAKLHRMVLAIQDIDCDFEHREGRKMIVPDTLSRLLDYADLYDSIEGEVLQTQHHLSTFEADETEKIVTAKQEREGAGVEHLKQQRWGVDQLQGEGTLDLEKRTLVRGLTLGSLRQCRKQIEKWKDRHDKIAKAITEGVTKVISGTDEKVDIAKQATGLRGQVEERLLSTLGGLEKLINLAAGDEDCSARLEEQYGEDYLQRVYPHRNEDGSIDMHIWEKMPEGDSSTRDILQAEGIQLEDQPNPAAIVAAVEAFQQVVGDLHHRAEELEMEAHDQLSSTIDAFTAEGLKIMRGTPVQECEATQNKPHTNPTELTHEEEAILQFTELTQQREDKLPSMAPLRKEGCTKQGPPKPNEHPAPAHPVMTVSLAEDEGINPQQRRAEPEPTPTASQPDQGTDKGHTPEVKCPLTNYRPATHASQPGADQNDASGPNQNGVQEHSPQEQANRETQEENDQIVEAETSQTIVDTLPLGVTELLWQWTNSNNMVKCNNIRAQETEPQTRHETIPPVAADLFAGAGGGIGAFAKMGFRAGACCEQGYIQQLALKDRYGVDAIKDWGDMRPHHFRGTFTVISCSPCTTFSTAGHKNGLEHKRGQYYPKQVQEATRARVPLIIIENVERVTEDMPHTNPKTGKPERESPMNLLKKQLSQQGYITHHEVLDAGQMKGRTRKCRAILQAMLPELQQHCERTQGTTEEAKRNYLKGRKMEVTHRIDEQGFIWPRHTGEKTSIGEIMIPWEQRPESHKLRVGEWSHFNLLKPTNRDGAIRLGNRSNDGSIGDRDNPNRVYSHEGRAPGITAMGNTGWYLVPEAAPADEVKRLHLEEKEVWGIVRLTGEEVKRMAGFIGVHDLTQRSSTTFSEDELHKMVNNALDLHLSERLAQGAICMYDEEWMRQHVRRTERDLSESLGYNRAAAEATNKLHKMTSEPLTLQNILGESERNVIIRANKTKDEVEETTTAIMQDLNPRKILRDERALHSTTVKAQHTVETYLGGEAHLITGGAPPTRASTTTQEVERQESETKEQRPETRKDRRYKVQIITTDKEVTKENVILRDSTSTMGDIGRHIPKNGIRRAQREDRELRVLMNYAETGAMPIEDPIDRGMLNTKEEYVIHNDILYHIGRLTGKSHTAEDEIEGDYYMQLVVPQALRSKLIKDYHANLGHASAKSVAESLKSRYWWPAMSRDIDLVVSECDTCQRYKATRPTCGGIKMQLTEEAGRPWETIWMDFIGPYGRSSTKKANTCALVIVDDFSRWIEATPCISSDSKTVAEALRGWILRHGFPRHIKSDRGSSLISKPMQLIYSSMGITKSESASLHPQSHGKVERANKHIQSCLRTYTAKGDMEWDDALMNAATSWNWSQKGLSGLSPYQIVHGYRPRMEFNDLDVMAPDTGTKFSSTTKWVQALMEQHTDLCNKLSDEHLNFKLKYIQAHNDQIRPSESNTFKVGQKVRVFLPATSSRTGLASKLQARYTTAYTIMQKITEHTYRVKKDNDTRPSVAVHANRLARYSSTSARTAETTAQCEIENLSDDTEEIDRTLSDLILGLSEESTVEGEHRAKAERTLAKYKHKGDPEPIGLDQAKIILNEMGEQLGDLEQQIKSGEWEFVCSNIERTLRGDIPQQKRKETAPDEELGDLEGHTLGAPLEPSNVEDQTDIENVEPTRQLPKPTNLRKNHQRTSPVRCITWTNPTTTVRKAAQQIKADCKILERDLAEHWVGAPPNHATYIKKGMKVPIQGQKKNTLTLSKGCKITMEHPNEVGNQVKGWIVTEITGQRTFKPEDPADGTTPTVHYHVTWDKEDLEEDDSPQEWVPVGRLTGCSEVIQRFKDKRSVSAVHVRGGQPYEILTASQEMTRWDKHPRSQAYTDTKEQINQHEQTQREVDQLMGTLPTAVAKEGHDVVIWDRQGGISPEEEQAIQHMCGVDSISKHTGMEPVLAAPIILGRKEALGSVLPDQGRTGSPEAIVGETDSEEDDRQEMEEARERQQHEKSAADTLDNIKEILQARSNQNGEYIRMKINSPGGTLALMHMSGKGATGPAKIIDLREHMEKATAGQWQLLQRCIQNSGVWGVVINPDHLTPSKMGSWRNMILEGHINHVICAQTYTDQGSSYKRTIEKWLQHHSDARRHDEITSIIARSPELASVLQHQAAGGSALPWMHTSIHNTVMRWLEKLSTSLTTAGGDLTVTAEEARAWNQLRQRITLQHRLRSVEEPDDMMAATSLLGAISVVRTYMHCHFCSPPMEPPPPPSTEAALATINTVVNGGRANAKQQEQIKADPRRATITGPDLSSAERAKQWTLQVIDATQGGLTFGELLERTAAQRYLKRWVLDLLHDKKLEMEPRGDHIGTNSRLTLSDTNKEQEAPEQSGHPEQSAANKESTRTKEPTSGRHPEDGGGKATRDTRESHQDESTSRAKQAEDQATSTEPQIRMIICDNPHPRGMVRALTTSLGNALEGSSTAQQELAVALSHNDRRTIASREIKDQIGLTIKSQREHLYSKQIESCLQANQRNRLESSIIQEGNVYHIIYITSHLGLLHKKAHEQSHKWTDLQHVRNLSREVRQKIYHLLHRRQQIRTSEAKTMGVHLYMAPCAGDGSDERATLYTTKALPLGKTLGNLHNRTAPTPEGYTLSKGHKVIHRLNSDGHMEPRRRTSGSDAVWDLAGRDRGHNCDIAADGSVTTTRIVRKGEALTLSYGYLPEEPELALVKGGQAEKQHHWQALDDWVTAAAADQEQADLNPNAGRELWEHTAALGEESPVDVRLGSFVARTGRIDLPVILQALHNDEDSSQTQQQSLTDAIKNRNIPALTIAAWSHFKKVANDDTQRIVASAKSKMMKSNLTEVIDLLKRTEVTNSETAREWEKVFLQGACKQLMDTIKQDEELRYNFQMCLTYAEEAQEAASKKQMIEEQALRNIPVVWYITSSTLMCTLKVHPHHLKSSRMAFAKGAEITVRVKDKDASTVAKGVIDEISDTDTSGLQSISVTVGRSTGNTEGNAIADVTPVYRSAQGMYQRTSLHRIWKCSDDLSKEFQDVRDFLMNRTTKTLEAGAFRRYGEAWEALRRDRGHPEHTEDQTEIMNKVWGNSYTLAQGPPGTGKSRTAVDVVTRALHVKRDQNYKGKIIIVVPTNVTAQDYVTALRGATLPGDDTPIRLVWVLGYHWEKRAEDEAARVSLSRYTIKAPTWMHDYLKRTHTWAEQEKLRKMHDKREKGGLTDSDEAEYYRLRNQAQKRVLSQAEVLVMTTQQAGKKTIKDLAKSERLTLRIIDESGMIGENDLSVVLALRCWRTLVIGDHEQLPARYDSRLAKKAKLQSSFADLVADNHRCTMLRHVFRNTLDSIAWVNNNIYKGRLKQFDWCRDDLTKRGEALKIFATPGCGKAWIELDATKAPESKPEGSTSKVNMQEAGVALQLVKRILQIGSIKAERISVITLYAAQEREIRQRIMECEELTEVKIGTIDAYQGKENDLIIFLTTRSSPQASEFIKDTHRMNVMLTRHKAGVIGIGTSAMPSCSPGWATLIQDYQRGGGLTPELRSHLEEHLRKEATSAEATTRIACISIPCELCMESKATRLFTTRDLSQGRPRWDPTAGGTYIVAKAMIPKGTNMFSVDVQELHQRELPEHNTRKRSMAWYVRKTDTAREDNIRWSYDRSNNTVYAHAMRDVPQGEEIKGKERAIEFADTYATLGKGELPQQTSRKPTQQKEAPAAAQEAPEIAHPPSLQESKDQTDARRIKQFKKFEDRVRALQLAENLRRRGWMGDRHSGRIASSATPNLSYLHIGTSEDEDKEDRMMRKKWNDITGMRGARLAWEVADYPYLRHKEYPDRQEFFQKSYVLGKNDPISKIQRWWDKSSNNNEARTNRARIHLAACVRATVLALRDLLYRLHSYHLQSSGQTRTSLDSARLDLEGVAYLLTDTAVGQIRERETERQTRVEAMLENHRKEKGKKPRPPSRHDPEEVGEYQRGTPLLEETKDHPLTREAPEGKSNKNLDESDDSDNYRQQPHTKGVMKLVLRAIIESVYSGSNEDAEALNVQEVKIACVCKGWSQYREMTHEWAQGDSGLPPRDNIGERHQRVYEEEIEANVQRICTIGQTIRHCARYMIAQDAEHAEKETNKDRAKDLNKEMSRHYNNMTLAQVKLLAHEKARTKIGQLTSRNATSWDRSARQSQDEKLQSRIEAWRITESGQPPEQHFNIKSAKEMIKRMPKMKIHTTYRMNDHEVTGLLGFLLKVDGGAMRSRVRTSSPRRPTSIHSDEMHLRKQRLGDLHMPDNQRGMNLVHHSSQLDMIWRHRQPGATKWLDDKEETTGRVMERKPANDETFGLFNIDARQQLPPSIKSDKLEMQTEEDSADAWRVTLEAKSPYIDQFIIIRLVTRSNEVATLTYREQWNNKKQQQDRDEDRHIDAFFYALLAQQHGGTCDHILAEWWALMWIDNEEINMGESRDPGITERVRKAAGNIRNIPDPDEQDHMRMPPDTGYILRYLRASQKGIQECQYSTGITDEDEGLPAHQAMEQWLKDMHLKGGRLNHIPRCDVQALDKESTKESPTEAAPLNLGINRHLSGTEEQHENHLSIYNIQTTKEETPLEIRGPQFNQEEGGDSDSKSETVALDEITTTIDTSKGRLTTPKSTTDTGKTNEANEDLRITHHEGGEQQTNNNTGTVNNNKTPEGGIPEETPTQARLTAPTWAERVRVAASAKAATTPPTRDQHEDGDGEIDYSEDNDWTTVNNGKTRKHEIGHTESISALDDDNYRAVYLHIHRRRIRRQHEEEAIRLILDVGVERFCLPYLEENKREYEDRVARMNHESNEGEQAIREYLKYEKTRELDERKSATLKSSELKARVAQHCEYNTDSRHTEWAEVIRRELTAIKDINPAIYHACRNLPRSGKLYTEKDRDDATNLLRDWTHWKPQRQTEKTGPEGPATRNIETQKKQGLHKAITDRTSP